MRGRFRFAAAAVSVWLISCAVVTAAFALPPERHYEMVSPIFKGGYGATHIQAVSLNGEGVAFFSPGAFAGAPAGFDALDYLARRGVSGWSTASLVSPASLIPEGIASDITPSLNLVLKLGKPGSTSQNGFPEEDLLLHSTETPDTPGNWELAGLLTPIIEERLSTRYESASASFCHMLLRTPGNQPLVPEAVGLNVLELYEFDRGCDGEPKSLALVGLNNKGKLLDSGCSTGLGAGGYGPGGSIGAFNAVSTDGVEVFFTVCLSGETAPSSPHQVFVRLGGAKTLEVSKPLEPGCVASNVPGEVPCDGAASRASADFAGASEDGSKVYFTTNAPLTESDKDTGNDLYMATIGCPESKPGCGVVEREVTSLTQVSHDPSVGQAAEVLGVVRVAPDGSRAYYVAGGDLLNDSQRVALESEGRAVPQVGAENLYVYDSGSPSTVAFIGDLCSGAELSGTAKDLHCPSATGTDATLISMTTEESRVQTAGSDGRFLAFSTYAQLLKSDSNAAQDVYRFDATTGLLVRVSGGENGYDSNGNRGVFNEGGEALGASISPGHYGGGLLERYESGSRAISEDGSRVVFTSAEPLSPLASNGLANAYEWHEGGPAGEGSVSLISSGGSVEPVNDVVISSDGKNVNFVTTEGLVSQDADGAPDIYDARLGEDFPPQPVRRLPCEGDACQGPLTNPAPLLVPGSVSQAPGGNFATPKQGVKSKKKAKAKRKAKKKGSKTKRRSGKAAVVRSGR